MTDPTTVSVTTDTRIILGSRARLVGDDDRLMAWAERHVRKDRDLKWILGNFVQADVANNNGHIFPLEDLKAGAHETVHAKPLNMIHHERYIVGSFVGTELIEPDPATAASDPSNPGDHRKCKSCGAVMAKDASTCQSCGAKWSASLQDFDASIGTPYVEALAGMWARIFPDEYELVRKAHKDGALFYSMECLPETVTCPECSHSAPFAGLQSDTYCAHVNASTVSHKRLDKPTFGAGAIIIPPIKPGWSRADINNLDAFLRQMPDGGESLYAGIASEFPHLDADSWEWMMGRLAHLATVDA